MSFITKGFPETTFYDFPTDRWSMYTYSLNVPLEALPDNKDRLFGILVNELLKKKDYWDSENADEKRTLKMLQQIAKSVKYEKGKCLMSLRVYTYSKKGKKVKTHIEDSIDIPEKMDAPANADFNQDYIDSKGKVRIEDVYYDLVTEGVPCECIFAVEHKKRSDEPSIPCEHCHGSGVIKCPECGGSGREQYVDGYYASGEERIKTGPCSECGGTGRIPCPECNGKGAIDIFASNYSLVRSVDEIVSKHVEGWAILPGERVKNILYSSLELEHKEPDGTIEGAIDRSYIYQSHDALNEVAKKGRFVYWKLNKKTFVEDNREEIKEIVEEYGLEDEYGKIVEKTEGDLDEAKRQRGEIVSLKEALFYFPVVTLRVKYGDSDEAKFVLFDKKGKACVNLMGLVGVSVGQALTKKFISLFKK